MATRIRDHDWSRTSLGRQEGWPTALKTLVTVILGSTQPMFVVWGPDRALIHNDAYATVLANKHPALGRDFLEVWHEISADLAPLVALAYRGEPSRMDDIQLVMHRKGYAEVTHWAYSYTPVHDDASRVAGFFCPCQEITDQVVAERNQTFRVALDSRIRAATEPREVMLAAVELLGRHLGANRVGYGEVQADDATVRLHSCYADAVEPLFGTYALDAFGAEDIARQRRGESQWCNDLTLDPAQDQAVWAAIDTRAYASVPLVRGGRLTASLYVNFRDAHTWTPPEIALVEEVAGRTWSELERARAEARLRESERRLRALVTASSYSIYRMSPDWREMRKLDGRGFLADTEAPSVRWLDVYIEPDERPRVLAAIDEAVRAGKTFELEHRVRRADGSSGWTLSRAIPILDDGGAVIEWFGAASDVTDRRRADAAIREREERLSLAIDAAEIGFWDVDPVSDRLAWPPRTKAMFGISPDTPVSMADFYAGLHPHDRDATAAAYAAAVDPDRRALYDVEYRTVGKEDGVVRWVAAKGRGVFDEEGRCVRVAGTAIDITARKATEAALAETEARYRTLFDSIDAGFCVIEVIFGGNGRPVDHVFREINPAFERQTGLSNVLGRRIRELHPDHEQHWFDAYGRVALTGEPCRFENRAAALGRWFDVHAYRIGPAEARCVAVLFNDVTARHAVEDQLRTLNETLETRVAERTAELEVAHEQLRQVQKLEAMGSLTGGVAHDFNNLLTPIVGALDMLQRGELGGARERRLIAGAVQSADRAKTLVQRLLAFARRQPLQAIAVDLGELVRNMADLVSSTTGPQIKVVVDVETNLPPASADPNQLEMALLNLSVNARDAMPDGGTLRISATARTTHAGERPGLRAGRYVCLSVADTGTGMDEATLARAVEPFFSTKGVGKGTGLGLSMVHGLASQLGGALAIRSTPGLGTNIELWLPETERAPETPRARPDIAPLRGRGRVLLVDDEELVRLSTADMLTDLGYEVVEAASAEAAMRALGNGARIDLVVTDHLMPGMSGTDLAAAVRERRPRLPVLIVSGYAEVEGLDPDLPRLTKPFRMDELAASVAALAEQSRT